jgi:hypothetical protein
VLLTRKTKACYDRFFKYIIDEMKVEPLLNIIIDFEQALYASRTLAFPLAKLNDVCFIFVKLFGEN